MTVPRHERYKDSGVQWLGDVPSHWATKRLRRLFAIKKRIVGTLGFDVLSITQQGLKIKDTESNDGQISLDYSKYQLVEPGDFAMNHMDLLTGYVDISRTCGVTSPDYRVFQLELQINVSTGTFFICSRLAIKQRYFMRLVREPRNLGAGDCQPTNSMSLFFRNRLLKNKYRSSRSSTARRPRSMSWWRGSSG
jgi:type I restriction enzyme S subunit